MYTQFKNSFKRMLENLPYVVGSLFILFIIGVAWPYLSVWIAVFGKEEKDNPVGSTILLMARISVLSDFFYFVMESLRPYFRVILINLGG